MQLFSYIYSTSSQTETSEVSTSTFFCLASCRRRASIWYAGMSVGMFLKYSMIVGKVKKENISTKPIHQNTSTSISHWCSSSFLDFGNRQFATCPIGLVWVSYEDQMRGLIPNGSKKTFQNVPSGSSLILFLKLARPCFDSTLRTEGSSPVLASWYVFHPK